MAPQCLTLTCQVLTAAAESGVVQKLHPPAPGPLHWLCALLGGPFRPETSLTCNSEPSSQPAGPSLPRLHLPVPGPSLSSPQRPPGGDSLPAWEVTVPQCHRHSHDTVTSAEFFPIGLVIPEMSLGSLGSILPGSPVNRCTASSLHTESAKGTRVLGVSSLGAVAASRGEPALWHLQGDTAEDVLLGRPIAAHASGQGLGFACKKTEPWEAADRKRRAGPLGDHKMLRGCPSGVPGEPSSWWLEDRVAMWRVWSARVAFTACLTLSLLLSPSRAVVRAVLDGNSSSVDFADLPALFGVPLSPQGMRGYLMEARPANACQPIEGPRPRGNGSLGAIVLIQRYDCTFDLKVLHAQRAGFEAAIVHNVRSNELVRMEPASEDLRRQIAIPAVFVGEAASQDLRVILRCDKSAHVVLLPDAPACPDPHCGPALAVAWTLGHSLASVVVAFLVLRHLGLWARGWWCGSPSVKTQTRQKAQVRIYTRHSDLCAICLDQYEEGDELKILPCSHAYHCSCINPWLAQAPRRACPLCKRLVASSEDCSDSSTESLGDEVPRPSIWAIQARLRPRAPRLLARANLRPRCSTTSLGTAEGMASPPGPWEPPDSHRSQPERTRGAEGGQ
ncbi:E3 ubiquitin-protein ligase ZNRF4 [Erethizon dorsatum]